MAIQLRTFDAGPSLSSRSNSFMRSSTRWLAVPLSLLVAGGIWYYYLRAVDRPASPPLRAASTDAFTNTTRYVLFRQLHGAGFNNQMQETILLSYIAALSGRTYVYHDVWRPKGDGWIPAERFFDTLTQPPAISEAQFWEACRAVGEGEVHTLSVEEVGPERLVEHTAALLRKHPGQCVYVEDRTIHWSFLETSAPLTLYPSIAPHLRAFTWSDDVLSEVERVQADLKLVRERYVAIHLRRGDFKFHCPLLIEQGAQFNLWARLPIFGGNETDILAHCWPSLSQILETIHRASLAYTAKTGLPIDTIYALHDAKYDAPWVWLLLRQLDLYLAARGVRFVYRDRLGLGLRGEVSTAVDVELARRASVFVGNGYSSLSSNVALWRLVDGVRPEDTLFW